jgi:hypothetical protein
MQQSNNFSVIFFNLENSKIIHQYSLAGFIAAFSKIEQELDK